MKTGIKADATQFEQARPGQQAMGDRQESKQQGRFQNTQTMGRDDQT
ncbi:hypothetical protein DFO61_1496 [Ectopseudomonas oleovorans]|uniref:Uncharacterized protein n=1 Tax=Ectopseudomonas oleovorans TaxID=301 RepID=A0A397NBP3_ECTOL|nr:hypothetical protein [Pseudomonas oleovorans]RIA34840.1 hypothetical protein DFO61_1496 [Pseudomonas oleovorans]